MPPAGRSGPRNGRHGRRARRAAGRAESRTSGCRAFIRCRCRSPPPPACRHVREPARESRAASGTAGADAKGSEARAACTDRARAGCGIARLRRYGRPPRIRASHVASRPRRSRCVREGRSLPRARPRRSGRQWLLRRSRCLQTSGTATSVQRHRVPAIPTGVLMRSSGLFASRFDGSDRASGSAHVSGGRRPSRCRRDGEIQTASRSRATLPALRAARDRRGPGLGCRAPYRPGSVACPGGGPQRGLGLSFLRLRRGRVSGRVRRRRSVNASTSPIGPGYRRARPWPAATPMRRAGPDRHALGPTRRVTDGRSWCIAGVPAADYPGRAQLTPAGARGRTRVCESCATPASACRRRAAARARETAASRRS